MRPGTRLRIREVAPWAGTVTTEGNGRLIVLGLAAAGKIWVWLVLKVDLVQVPAYPAGMSDELSKRIDDLHKRFDDLRADMGRQFSDLRGEMNRRLADVSARIADTKQRIDDLRADVNQRFTDMNLSIGQRFDNLNLRLTDMHGTLRTFMWVVSGWFTFLTAVLAGFGFLRR